MSIKANHKPVLLTLLIGSLWQYITAVLSWFETTAVKKQLTMKQPNEGKCTERPSK